MIRAVHSHRGQRWTLRVQGHAQSAPYGRDLVCAAVTALVCTLAQHLLDHRGQGDKPPVLRLDSGDAEIIAEGKNLGEPFSFVMTGLKLLAREYPGCVTVTEEM